MTTNGVTLKPITDGWALKQAASTYSKNASFVYNEANTAPVLDLLNAQPGERILDIGCGGGELTGGPIASAVGKEGSVVGADASEAMIAAARATFGRTNVEFHVVDGQRLTEGLKASGVEEGFDAVFSNAALHWMKDADAVVKGVKALIKPGGRYCAEMGGYLNIVGLRGSLAAALRRRGVDPATVDPWYFPTPKQYTTILEANGFKVEQIGKSGSSADPTPTGLRGWLETFANFAVAALPNPSEVEKAKFFSEIEEDCRCDMYAEGEGWCVMYVRLRFKAIAV